MKRNTYKIQCSVIQGINFFRLSFSIFINSVVQKGRPQMRTHKNFFSIFIILISSICFGSLTSYPGPASSSMKQIYPGLRKYTTQWEWFNNGPRLTAAIGPFILYPFVYRFGRQIMLSVVALCNGLCFLLLLAANENMMTYLLIIRLIHGIFWGAISTITLIYLFDMSPSNSFGFTGCMHQFFNVFGLVLNNILAAFIDFRVLSVICALLSFIAGGLIWLIPDSNVSIKNKQRRKFQKAQRRLRRNGSNNDSNRRRSISIQNSTDPNRPTTRRIEESKDTKEDTIISDSSDFDYYSIADSLCQRNNLSVIIRGCFMFLFQQFSGANAILANLTAIMASSGLAMDPNLQSCMANLAQLIAILVPALLVDFYGPRLFWLLSCVLLVIFLLFYATTIQISFPSYTPVLCIFLYRLAFGFGMGPLTYAAWVQLLTENVRAIGCTIMMSVHWFISWVVVITFTEMNENIGRFNTVIVYAVSTFIAIFFGIFFVPGSPIKETGEMALI